MTYTQFYDSSKIGDIPQGATHLAAYHDGAYAVTDGQIRRVLPAVSHVRWITIGADFHSGIADFEPRNPVYDDAQLLRRWALGRLSLQMGTPIVYSDRANIRAALDRLDGLRVFWWIPTLDDREWTAAELAADLAANWDAPVPAGRIWGNQFHSQEDPTFDRSNLFGSWWA
jgi:hypothetical protein